MTLAYLTSEYPAVSHTFILREVAELRSQGRDVTTFSLRRTGSEHRKGAAEAEEARRTIYLLEHALNPLTALAAQARALRRPGRWLSMVRLAMRTSAPGLRAAVRQVAYVLEAGILAREMETRGITHLHNHFANASCSVAMLASELTGIPYSLTLHGPATFFDPHRLALGEKIARARFVACISHFARSQGMIFADPAHWERMHIVHCGVDPARYGASPDRGEAGSEIVFVGRLAAVKGVLVLLEAVAQLANAYPQARVTLIGDGPERARIEARVAALGLGDRVTFTGYLTQTEVAARLASASIFALPSFAEGVPVVLMEAMAAELPVVATRIAGIGELVTDGEAGLLVPPGDVKSFSAAIETLLADPKQRIAMGRAGRAAVVASYDIAQEAARLGQLFDGTPDTDSTP
ncbi:MAG: glycosyltransferase family 4 protein [Pseudomonadota bacterium]